MKLKIAFTLLIVGAAFCLQAQDMTSSTLIWTAENTLDVDQGRMVAGNVSVISYPNKIDWISASGAVQYSFTITRTTGFWPNVNLLGEISFEVDQNGKTGTIQFRKDGSGVFIRLNLSTPTAPDITQLKISSVKNQ